jgi:hypothetical protein
VLLLDQAAHVGAGDVGLVAVVERDQAQLASMDPAAALDLGERRLDSGEHAVAEVGGRPAERGRHAEDEVVAACRRIVAHGRRAGRSERREHGETGRRREGDDGTRDAGAAPPPPAPPALRHGDSHRSLVSGLVRLDIDGRAAEP